MKTKTIQETCAIASKTDDAEFASSVSDDLIVEGNGL